MKTKIYNNLIFSLLFVCNICGFFGGVSLFAQSKINQTILAHAKEVITYTATRSEVRTGQEGKYVEVSFSAFTSNNNWDDDIGGNILKSTTGRGYVPISFRITKGEMFFSGGGVNKVLTNWGPKKEATLSIYFKGELPDFCVTPSIRGYALNEVCPTIPPDINENQAPPTTLNSAKYNQKAREPLTLHLYSTIFGAGKTIETSSTDRESVSRMIQGIFGRFFSIIFTLSGILMVVLLAVHGTRMIYAEFGGNVTVFSDAKKRVTSAALGTGILLLSWLILNFIDPNLLRPRLFQTITQLQEVGSGSELYANNLEIPKDSISFNESDYTLVITRCPEIKDDRFRQQVDDIAASLRGEVRYAYQILYSKIGSNEVYVHDGKKEYGYRSGGSTKFIECKQHDRPSTESIQLPPETENLVVFPVVFVVVEESGQVANSNKKTSERKKVWRGLPWKNENRFAIDPVILKHAKEVITYTATRSAVQTGQEGKYVEVDFSAFTSNNNWDDDIGGNILKSTTGKGNVSISFRITKGEKMFFSGGGDNKVLTNWKPGRKTSLAVYFEGELSDFCITPSVKRYVLNERCFNASP